VLHGGCSCDLVTARQAVASEDEARLRARYRALGYGRDRVIRALEVHRRGLERRECPAGYWPKSFADFVIEHARNAGPTLFYLQFGHDGLQRVAEGQPRTIFTADVGFPGVWLPEDAPIMVVRDGAAVPGCSFARSGLGAPPAAQAGLPVLVPAGPSCPNCGLRFERGEEGYWVGSYMFNIVASELLFAVTGITVVVTTWPTPPWTAITVGGVIMMLLAPLLFLPFSKVLFLAFDLCFRPPVEADFSAPSEPAIGRRA
jgi:hypothetical protein